MNREPAFSRMSNNIGRNWIEKHLHETYWWDDIIFRGHPVKPPRYYDKVLEELDDELYIEVLDGRKLAFAEFAHDCTEERLIDREKAVTHEARKRQRDKADGIQNL